MALFTAEQWAAIEAAAQGFSTVLAHWNRGHGLLQRLQALHAEPLVVAGQASADSVFAEALTEYASIKAELAEAVAGLP